MVRKLLILLLLPLTGLHAQNPLFNSSMPVVADGSVYSPAGEGVANIIDNDSNTKFLDFNYWDGLGFTVNTNSMTIATGFDITTANDSPERDPMVYEVLGSVDGLSFTSIASGSIPCITDRFFARSFSFTNTIAYQHYRVILTNQCNTIEQMIQVAEVQLTGTALSTAAHHLAAFDVQLYPNPTNEFFQIKAAGEAITGVIVMDAFGKTVKTTLEPAENSKINIQELSLGIYFVKIETAGVNVIKKLVVK